MLLYPAKVERDGDGFLVTFPDIPEATTSGSTRDEAIDMAADALITAMDFYFEDRRPVPPPSRVKRGQASIELPPSVAAKVLLLNEMVAQQKRPSELARTMHIKPQEVTRLLDLHHPTKIDAVAAALSALGRRLEVSLAD